MGGILDHLGCFGGAFFAPPPSLNFPFLFTCTMSEPFGDFGPILDLSWLNSGLCWSHVGLILDHLEAIWELIVVNVDEV